MRRNFWILSLLLATACTIHQENGQDLRADLPPLLVGNSWRITQQSSGAGGRVCTVSAGEMDVTQRSAPHGIAYQVATSSPLNPGDRYRVIMGGQVYETMGTAFRPADSEAIIHGFGQGGVVYTEIQERVIRAGSEYERLGNKIDLSGFGEPFKACARFVKGG